MFFGKAQNKNVDQLAHSPRWYDGNRLIYYGMPPTTEYWTNAWQSQLRFQNHNQSKLYKLKWIDDVAIQYFSKNGCILEAGCGLAENVVALKAIGYNVEGVEWSYDTVMAVLKIYPDLPIRVGDVTHLNVPDGYYAGYISLGVMEHRIEGPEVFLQEARRVLADNGIAIISVPYINFIRNLKARLGCYRFQNKKSVFYQYAFTEHEFSNILKRHGFKVVDKKTYDIVKGITDEIPFVTALLAWPMVGWRLKKFLKIWEWGNRNLGHMILFVCRKQT